MEAKVGGAEGCSCPAVAARASAPGVISMAQLPRTVLPCLMNRHFPHISMVCHQVTVFAEDQVVYSATYDHVYDQHSEQVRSRPPFPPTIESYAGAR